MVEEMEAFEKNEAYDLVNFPNGRKPIGSKWVFKKKQNVARKVEKYKPRLVVKGYSRVVRSEFGELPLNFYCILLQHLILR